VVSLALGIGANTAIFSLTDQVLLRLLPVKDPRQLVLLWGRGQHYGSNNGRYKLSYPMYADFRDKNQVFSGMFCRWESDFSVSFGGRTERVSGELVSGSYFPVLGVGAAVGRVFSPEDEQTPGGHPYAVLSYRYWVSRFASDPRIVGQKMIINGYPLTIVGVSQAGFDGLDPGSSPQIRVPLMMKKEMDQVNFYTLTDRRGRWVNAYGRLKPGVTLAQAKAGLQPLFHQMLEMEVREAAFAKTAELTKQNFLRMFVDLLPASKGNTEMQREFSNPLLVLMALVGVVLLIACANLANLLVARATARQKEMAVRLALGASRTRIVAQLMVESMTLAVIGGAAGLALAAGIVKLLAGFMPPGSSQLTISPLPDGRILLFTLGVSLLTGVVFGLVPALQATKADVAPTLKDQAGSVAGGASVGLRKALAVVQVTLSLVLLVAASLFIRSLRNLKDLDPGFRTHNLLTFTIDPPLSGYKPDRARDFYRQLSEALNTLPGVESAGFAVVPVLAHDEWDSSMAVENYAAKPGEWVDPHMNFISPEYFQAMGIPMLLGRGFTTKDDQKTPKAAIVNEKFAKRYFADGNPIGRHIGMGGNPGTVLDIEIVGVVRDAKYETMRDEIPLEVYRPYRQMEFVLGMTAYARTQRDPDAMFPVIRRVVAQLDPNLPVSFMKTLDAQMDESLMTERLVAGLSGAFGLLATLLASVGLYGVMSYTVARRTREIGIRMALGASRVNVLGMVMKEVALLASIGVAVGVAAALALTGLVRKELYGIQPNDPATVALAGVAIALVALLAGFLPARRAVRIDPMRALRWE
jgi:putative ABC transport system permease protein